MKSQTCTPRVTAPWSFSNHRALVSLSKFNSMLVLLVVVVLSVSCAREAAATNVAEYHSNDGKRSCVCSFDEDTDYFPVKLGPNRAGNFEVEYRKHYKKITAKLGDNIEETYYAYLCGTPAPEIPEGESGTLVEIPLRTVGLASTTFLPFLEYIRQRDSIRVLSAGGDFLTSSCLRKRIAEGIVETPESFGVDTEDIASEVPQVIFTDQWSHDAVAKQISELNSITRPVYFLSDNEADALGAAEFVEYAALFFNREEAAKDVLDNIVQRYNCAVSKATTYVDATPSAKPNVLFLNGFYQGQFTVEHCPTEGRWYCGMFQDLGIELVSNGTREFLSMEQLESLPLETVDVVLFTGDLRFHLDETDPEKQSDVYDVVTRRLSGARLYDTSKNANAWFQMRVAEPDVLMQDLVSVLFPAVDLAPHQRFYLRDVRDSNDLQLNPQDDACPDTTQPLFTNYRASACNSSLIRIPGLSRAEESCDPITTTDSPVGRTELGTVAAMSAAVLALAAALA